jgi:hypothetical protein
MRTKEFYDFIIERENVRLRKAAGLPAPWTEDKILQQYKFTNVFRKHDKTTQKLIGMFYRDYGQHEPMENILFNCALFRYFGTYEFASAVGWQGGIAQNPDFRHIIKTARDRLNAGERVFTGAYIITNQGIKAPKEEVVVNTFLQELWQHRQQICDTARETNNWQSTHEVLQKVLGFGGSGFMAKETLLDTMHCKFWEGGLPNDYWDWTPIGPGARRGINRLLNQSLDIKMDSGLMLEVILKLVGEQYKYWPKEWEKLSPSEGQFQLCEFDKINRVRNGEGRPRSKYNGMGLL